MKISGKRFLVPVLQLALLGSLLFSACSRFSPAAPSVLLIVIDTIRPDRIGCYGSTTVQTPSIDRLASEGVLFENGFTQAAYTLPSMSTIMTSLYPYRHQVRSNRMNLSEEFGTLAELFQSAGYRTGAILGSAVLDGDRNLSQGFDHYDDSFPEKLTVYSETLKKAGIALGSNAERRANDVTDRALEWATDHNGKPFFLFAHYFDPHSQYDPPPPFRERYKGRNYDGEVAFTDQEIGRLIDGLREAGYEENLLVVLTGDHGEGLGDHGEANHGFFVYDQTIRIPLIIKYPGYVNPGTRTGKLVSAVDILPTIAELLRLKPPHPVDGHSMAGIFRDENFNGEPVYSEAFSGYFHYGWSPTRSIRTDKWKYVEAPVKELYNIGDDPGETTNLYDSDNEIAIRLERIMRKHLIDESRVLPIKSGPDTMSEVQKARLEALGYVSTNRGMPEELNGLPDPKGEVAKFNRRQMAKVYTSRGFLHLQAGRHDEAKAEFTRSLKEMSEYAPALRGLASIHFRNGSYREAELLYRRAVESEPENREIYLDLAVSLNRQNRLGEAIEALKSCPPEAEPHPKYEPLLQSLLESQASNKSP